MLADKKKRKKFSPNPQGNIWHQDKSKFGQKLLEKMGWKEGQGLGAQNQGISERIKVPFRLNNCAGFGFKEQEDTLIQQKEFVTLLSSMNNSKPEEPLNNSNVSSLEDKSKNSRARVHYHKFTRGKDLSRYSSKDLVGIFGKQEIVDEVCSNELTFESFKKKEDDCDNRLEQDDTVNLKKKTKKKKKIKEQDEAPMEIAETDVNCELELNDDTRVRKKSKKRQKTNETDFPSNMNGEELTENSRPTNDLEISENDQLEKVSISGKQEIVNELTSDELVNYRKEGERGSDLGLEQDDTVNHKKKTKKKKKVKELDEYPMEITATGVDCELELEMNKSDDKLKTCDTEVEKKSKKRQRPIHITETNANSELDVSDKNLQTSDIGVSKKSKKRHKPKEITETDVNRELDVSDNNLLTADTDVSKKSKKRQKPKESDNLQSNSAEDVQQTNDIAINENNSLEKETNCGAFSNRENDRFSNKRNMKPDVNGFRGSNLPKIVGYACN